MDIVQSGRTFQSIGARTSNQTHFPRGVNWTPHPEDNASSIATPLPEVLSGSAGLRTTPRVLPSKTLTRTRSPAKATDT